MEKETAARSLKWIASLEKWLWPVLKTVFRIEVSGEHHLRPGPALIIANHNSGALVESHSLLFLCFQKGLAVFGLNHKALFKIPLVSRYFRKIGAVTASREAAAQVLRENASLLIFPGGSRQALRPLSQAHINSFEWAKGWAELAVTHQAPVVPVKFTGTHGINPILFSSHGLSASVISP